jgi:uncharacterized protein (DUF885 family)
VHLQPADTPDRLDRLIARLAAFPGHVDAHNDVVREAAAAGVVQPRVIGERTVAQLERLLAAGADGSPLTTGARVAVDADRARVAAAVAQHVLPAYERLRDAISDGYLPYARDELGLGALADGEQRYALAIRQWTTVDVTPRELHDRGWAELEQLEQERRRISRTAGLGDDTAAYRRMLDSDPPNIPASEEALLGRMREDVERAWQAAARVVGRLPQTPCLIEPLDKSQAADALGYYLEPSPESKRPGVFYMNTTSLRQRTFSRYATVTYHESIPGHHLQIALEVEAQNVSPARRFVGQSLSGAFIEGWGLYSERVADEVGLFRNDQERFGMIESQAWRAARLVVDTGLHAFGWDRQRAIDTFVEATGFDEPSAAVEVDRYVANPAQALAYKVGQRSIEELRAEIATARGSEFDLRAFHDAVLGNGSLPLPIMADAVRTTLGDAPS